MEACTPPVFIWYAVGTILFAIAGLIATVAAGIWFSRSDY